jgi:hypothetical protein
MNIEAEYQIMQIGSQVKRRYLSGNMAVDIISITDRSRWTKTNQKMHVWQSAFLKLNYVGERDDLTEDAPGCYFFYECISFHFEYPRRKVRSQIRRLVSTKVVPDFRPIGITCESYEQIRRSELVNDCHIIEVQLVHIPGAPDECGWKNNLSTDPNIRIAMIAQSAFQDVIIL